MTISFQTTNRYYIIIYMIVVVFDYKLIMRQQSIGN